MISSQYAALSPLDTGACMPAAPLTANAYRYYGIAARKEDVIHIFGADTVIYKRPSRSPRARRRGEAHFITRSMLSMGELFRRQRAQGASPGHAMPHYAGRFRRERGHAGRLGRLISPDYFSRQSSTTLRDVPLAGMMASLFALYTYASYFRPKDDALIPAMPLLPARPRYDRSRHHTELFSGRRGDGQSAHYGRGARRFTRRPATL